jgi:hypothetical protein
MRKFNLVVMKLSNLSILHYLSVLMIRTQKGCRSTFLEALGLGPSLPVPAQYPPALAFFIALCFIGGKDHVKEATAHRGDGR